jgi:hypothetical protein
MRSALSWDIAQLAVAIPYRRFRSNYHFHLQGLRRFGTTYPPHLEEGIGCPKRLARNYCYTLHNIPEERISQIAYWSADIQDTQNLNKASHMQHLQCLGKNFKQIVIICSPAVRTVWALKEVISKTCCNMWQIIVNDTDCYCILYEWVPLSAVLESNINT